MAVLIACEESQTATNIFREHGIEAYSCDIQPCSGGHPEYHIQDDLIYVLKCKWNLIIAHPPCTYLTKTSAPSLFPKPGVINLDRYYKGLDARKFFYKILLTNCKHICIENPTPLKIFGLPEPSQIIQPYYFGEPYSKRTCLWLYGLPPLMSTCIVEKYQSYNSLFSNPKTRSFFRSKSFPGIADAMVNQWISYCN